MEKSGTEMGPEIRLRCLKEDRAALRPRKHQQRDRVKNEYGMSMD